MYLPLDTFHQAFTTAENVRTIEFKTHSFDDSLADDAYKCHKLLTLALIFLTMMMANIYCLLDIRLFYLLPFEAKRTNSSGVSGTTF